MVTLPKGAAAAQRAGHHRRLGHVGADQELDDAWLLLSWFNTDDWYGIQSKRLQPARLSWLPKWQTMLVEAYPELQGKNLKAFTMGAEQGFARPWELHRYHAASNSVIQTAFEESVTRNQKPVKDTHIEVARQVNEIQAKEQATAGGK